MLSSRTSLNDLESLFKLGLPLDADLSVILFETEATKLTTTDAKGPAPATGLAP